MAQTSSALTSLTLALSFSKPLKLYPDAQKLVSETFDAGAAFTFGFAEDEDPQWTLVTLRVCQHALSHSNGRPELRACVHSARMTTALACSTLWKPRWQCPQPPQFNPKGVL